MPDLSKYDLDFRPKNYWDLRDVLTFVEAKITGKERKEIIKKEIQEGRRVPEELLKGSLDKNLRKLLGSMHPSFMGGEYLPKLEDADVIIASINLESTTSDVIVVIARLTDRGIEYRVEDEYLDSYPEGREHFKVQPKFSKEPLSFKELIDLIDSAEENGGLVESAKNCNYEAEIGYELEDVYDFGTAKSAFYPQLEDWYDEVNEEWLKKKKEELRQVKIEDEKVVPVKELEQDIELLQQQNQQLYIGIMELWLLRPHNKDRKYHNKKEVENQKSDLVGAELIGMDLSGAKLSGAKLAGADLRYANLTKADLRHADLWGAVLCGAKLANAKFDDADLSLANLTDVMDLIHVDLKNAKTWGTIGLDLKKTGTIVKGSSGIGKSGARGF